MTLRTPNPILNARAALDLQRVKEQMALLSLQISTGQRIVRPGDDPTGAAVLVDFRSSISRNEQYERQINSAYTFLRSSESNLQVVSDHLVRLIEMAAESKGAGNIGSAYSGEVQAIRSSLISIANAQSEGKYLFAGTQTTTQPFSDAGVSPTTYSGDAGIISVDYNLGASVATNLPGHTVFFGSGGQGSATDMFQQVSDLLNAFTSNNAAAIQTAAANIESIFGTLQSHLADLGGRESAVQQMQTSLGDFNLGLKSIQESLESVDYPQASAEYQKASVVQQAALSMLSKSTNQNLFNFLS